MRIADNGRGIPAKFRRKIFGRFERLGLELERDKPGTGLGLYIVRNLAPAAARPHPRPRPRGRPRHGLRGAIARRHRSPATASRRTRTGSEPREHRKIAPWPPKNTSWSWKTKSTWRPGIKYNLVAEGYRVTTVGDGPAALQLLDEPRRRRGPGGAGPDVAGHERLRGVRGACGPCDRDMPVLILSARTLAEDRTRGFDVGANQYMTKPFDLDEFLSRVRNLLTFYRRRARRAAAPGGRG